MMSLYLRLRPHFLSLFPSSRKQRGGEKNNANEGSGGGFPLPTRAAQAVPPSSPPKHLVTLFLLTFIVTYFVISERTGKDAIMSSAVQSRHHGLGALRETEGLSESCALLFFGLPKMLEEICLPSITDNLLRVNPMCDVYAHTYDVNSTSNPRNFEENVPLNPESVYLLTGYDNDNALISSEEEFASVRDVDFYRQYFPERDNWLYPDSMDVSEKMCFKPSWTF